MLHFPTKCLSCWARAGAVAWRNIISQRDRVPPAAEPTVPAGPGTAGPAAAGTACHLRQVTARARQRQAGLSVCSTSTLLHGKAFCNAVISFTSWMRIFLKIFLNIQALLLFVLLTWHFYELWIYTASFSASALEWKLSPKMISYITLW